MNRNYPSVYILLPIYNAAPFLAECLESIKQQTYDNWQLIAINDGSTDSSAQILKDFKIQHPQFKINLFHHQNNRGLVATLNRGLKIIEKKSIHFSPSRTFVARIDADDIMRPKRLEKQVLHLIKHPENDFLGSNYLKIDQNKNQIGQFKTYRRHKYLQKALLFYNPFGHPTLMWRLQWQKKVNFRYPTEYIYAEDYAAWIKFAPQTNFQNLADNLVYYRQHPMQISRQKTEQQNQYTQQLSFAVQKTYLQRLSHHQKKIAQIIFSWTKIPKTIKVWLLANLWHD